MMIHRMRASFGKLHDTLELQPGFNSLCLPNEAGKSTWSAFLVAMLYGIDTSERANAANQGLPMKERYKPWDGSPMEGTIELEWQGREITIERKTERRTPMGAFRAYETASGIPVPELTGENCGRILCGVERSVFERTAFIRQLGMAVTPDPVLEKRLGALVTTGEEGSLSYSQLEAALKGLKNKLSGRTGSIPRLKDGEEELENNLGAMERLEGEVRFLKEREKAAEQERSRLEELEQRVRRTRDIQQQSGLRELREKLALQQSLCRRLEQTVEKLPAEEDLQRLQRELDAAERNLQAVRMDTDMGMPTVERPVPPTGFAQMTGPEAVETAQKDLESYEKLTAQGKKLWTALGIALGGVGVLGGIYGIARSDLIFAIAGAVLVAAAAVSLLLEGKARKDRKHKAEMILARYGIQEASALPEVARAYGDQMAEYEENCRAQQEERTRFLSRLEQAQKEIQAIAAQVQKFAPNFADTVSCRETLAAALKAHEHLAGERRTLELLRKQENSMKNLMGQEVGEEPGNYDLEQLSQDVRRAKEACYDLTAKAAQKEGALRALGETAQVEARLYGIREALREAQEQSDAITLAMEALKRADSTLRSRFSPQITADAGKILEKLTQGKYTKLVLQPDMKLSLRQNEDVVTHGAAAMSCGTADQMYLALRLAMCERLLPEDAPLVLDDALVNFDDQRGRAAMDLLRKLGEKRQIIFFTCHEFGEN